VSGSPDEALAHLDRALEIKPDHVVALTQRGVALEMLGRGDEAVQTLRRAIELAPEHALAHFWLAAALVATGEDDDGRAAFRRAVELNPRSADGLLTAAKVFMSWGLEERARQLYRYAAVLQPDDPELQHMIAAARLGDETPGRATPESVEALFDRFAATFEQRLGDLGYRPAELVAVLREARPEPLGAVLDAGCGTGLCGPLLRPHADRLEGVDISGGMLERAQARGVYDELRQADLLADLGARPGEYDTVVAADVLIYFGALDELMRAVRGALRSGGAFGFSVERCAGADHELTTSGRYRHSLEHVRRAAEAAGFTELAMEERPIRSEMRKPVPGLMAVLQAA
jgi:predicted TPR repeat methyltransferase